MSDIAIKVENVSKTFKIPHEKVSSLRGAAVSMFSRNKGYEEFKALDDVSFEVKKGEFFGIIGRNGSGKSTLLKILAGIYQPDKGKVHINGRISPFLELGIGFNPELSGRDNVYLNATVLGLTKKEIDEKFDSIVKFSELERFIDQKLKNYSSGMQVRLAFSVSIHANREILLMDEVLAVGDSNFQAKCLEEFNKYREIGKTVILISHDIETIKNYCDRVLLLKSGKILGVGKSGNIIEKYIDDNIKNDQENHKNEPQITVADYYKKKPVEIVEVNFFDKDEKSKNIFSEGDFVSIVVSCFFNEKIIDPEFGITLKDSNGTEIFGTNTILQNIRTGTFNSGLHKICFNMESIAIHGKFYITPAVSSNNALKFFDWREGVASFNVISNSNLGLLSMKHSIKIA